MGVTVFLILCLGVTAWAGPCEEALRSLRANPHRRELSRYETTRILSLLPQKAVDSFRPETGLEVTGRDSAGNAVQARVRVLSDNAGSRIQVLSELNGWGLRASVADELRPVPGTPYFEGVVPVRHGMEYRLLVNGTQLLDPAAEMHTTAEFSTFRRRTGPAPINSVFWDFDRPGAYRQQAAAVDLRGRAAIIAETEVHALVARWKGGPGQKAETYRFVAESGVIDEMKRMGYNAVEFLPFTSSVDGDSWHLRYQVFGNFGPDSRFGSPDEFARMCDAFNRAGIAIVMDAVVGHFPVRGNSGDRDLGAVGLHHWKKSDGQNLFGSVWSPWGTYRYDYANPYVRRFLIDGILQMMRRYRISGVRVDNLDGIRFYEGPGGGGPEFLTEMAAAIRTYRPDALLIGEMFFGENRVLGALDRGGMGFGVRTHSNLFDFFKDNMRKRTEEIDLWALQSALRDPWSWGEAMRLHYPTNHDEAANQRDGATGAYVASLVNGGGWDYVVKKTKAFGALALLTGAAYLDMPQMRLLQEGTFYSNPSVDWALLQQPSQRSVNEFFGHLSRLVGSEAAFSHQNLTPDTVNHTDHANKVISIERTDHATGRKIYAVVNLSHQSFDNYAFGVNVKGELRLLVDSDRTEFSGSGELNRRIPDGMLRTQGWSLHGKSDSVSIAFLPAYGVLVFATP